MSLVGLRAASTRACLGLNRTEDRGRFLPRGEMGQQYLVAGKRVSMRLWVQEPGGKLKAPTTREYETVGYVISGSERLDLEKQTLNLKAGDSWLVPAGAMHQYTVIEPFTAVEATAAPAEVHGRDTPA
jgi:quercetin dioxygenase-like cupin family protein